MYGNRMIRTGADIFYYFQISIVYSFHRSLLKETEGYVVRRLEDEYLVLPSGRRTEEVNEVISLSETAGFIYMHAERAENVDELAQLVAEEYEIEPAEVLEDVRNVVLTLQKKGILL